MRGRVATIRERSVELESRAVFPFDYLILAPGSTYADNAIKDVGGTAAERQALIQVGLRVHTRLRTRCLRWLAAGRMRCTASVLLRLTQQLQRRLLACCTFALLRVVTRWCVTLPWPACRRSTNGCPQPAACSLSAAASWASSSQGRWVLQPGRQHLRGARVRIKVTFAPGGRGAARRC